MKRLVAASCCAAWLLGGWLYLGAADTGTQATRPPAAAPARTLAASWQEVRQELQAGDSAAALAALDSLFARFSGEPELQSAQVDLLPVYADLCLAHNRAGEAATLYRQWLALPQTGALLPRRIAILGALASASETIGDRAGTASALQELIAIAPAGDARKDLARLQRAGMADEPPAAIIARLRSLASEPAYPPPLQTRARLQAVYLALQSGLLPEAADSLLAGEWQLAQMPELAQLSLAAMRVGEYLLHQEQPEQALRALTLVTPQPRLLHLQRLRRADVARALRQQEQEQRAGSTQAAAGVRFLAAQLTQIDHQLELLEQAPDTAASLLNLRASAFLLAGRPWHAAIVFHAAANAAAADNAPDNATAALALRARYNRLLALQQAGREQRLRDEAATFAETYPQHPLTRKARSLQAESLLRTRQYGEAVRLLDSLLQTSDPGSEPPGRSSSIPPSPTASATLHAGALPVLSNETPAARQAGAPPALSSEAPPPQPPSPASDLVARLHFQRGYANAFLGNYEPARNDFAAAAALARQPLLDWARYWSGQTDMLAADYSRAQAQLAHVLPKMDTAHPAYPYAHFSHAQALYATHANAQAQAALLNFLETDPEHERAASARLLLAESHITAQQVSAALDLLDALTTTAPEPVRGQALLRKGEILERLAKPLKAVALYATYLQNFSSVNAPGQPPDSITPRGTPGAQLQQGAHAALPPVGSDNYARVVERMLRLLLAQSEPARAQEALRTALHAHANNPAMGDFTAMLAHAFRLGFAPQALASTAPDSATTAAQPHALPYPLWLEAAREAALAKKQMTLYARLSHALARHYSHSDQSALQQAVLLQIAAHAPPAALDEATLETVSAYLSERGHSATEIFLAELAGRHRDALPQPAALLWGQAQQALHAANAPRAADLLQQLGVDWPLHPLRAQALPLQAQLAQAAGNTAQERQHWQALLAQPGSTPAARAGALLALARLYATTGELPAAINHYQRLYTLYRAQGEAATHAYLESALLFEALGDTKAASATYEELLHSTDLAVPTALREQAETAQSRLHASADAALPPPAPPPPAAPSVEAVSATEAAANAFTAAIPPRAGLTPAIASPSATTSRALLSVLPPPLPATSSLPATLPAQPLAASIDAAHTQTAPATASNADWHALIRTPAQVQLVYGGALTADILGIQGARLHLRLREGGSGIGETALPLERVLRIDFADAPVFAHTDHLDADGQTALAYARRKELYTLREKALPFVSDATLRRFADLAHEAIQQREPLFAARIARRCLDARSSHHPDALPQPAASTQPAASRTQSDSAAPIPAAHGHSPHHRAGGEADPLPTRFADAKLLALWQLNLREQAVSLATARLNAADGQPAPPASASALPHAMLAMDALAHADPDAALELALRPIALRPTPQQPDLPYLETAYAVALEAAVALRQDALLHQLQADAATEGITLTHQFAPAPALQNP